MVYLITEEKAYVSLVRMFNPLVNISRSLTTAARSKRRVVVTGIGVVCPLGVGTQNAWRALIDSKCGITKLCEPDYDKLPCKVGEQFKNISHFMKIYQFILLNKCFKKIFYIQIEFVNFSYYLHSLRNILFLDNQIIH